VIILLVFGIISIGRALFAPNNSPQAADTDAGRQTLLDTSTGHSVRLTVRGPIVAKENFRSYQITVSPSARIMNVYTGYLGTVEGSSKLDNNQKAYEQFVYALDKANMMRGVVPQDDARNDVRGICASGYVYEYDVLVANQSQKRLWTSTCEGSKGTLQASIGQLNALYHKQIPDYEKIYPFKTIDAQLRM
jgi:hypothetical protein